MKAQLKKREAPPVASANNNLLSNENRGNTVVSQALKTIETIELFDGERYSVTVSFSEETDESAQQDVLSMLMNMRREE